MHHRPSLGLPHHQVLSADCRHETRRLCLAVRPTDTQTASSRLVSLAASTCLVRAEKLQLADAAGGISGATGRQGREAGRCPARQVAGNTV